MGSWETGRLQQKMVSRLLWRPFGTHTGQAVTVIHGDSQAQHAFESATALADTLRQLAENAASLRAQTAVRIATEEKLSLSVLATRIGVSKARAEQLVKSVKDEAPDSAQEGEGITSA